jgi:hypothetical protein
LSSLWRSVVLRRSTHNQAEGRTALSEPISLFHSTSYSSLFDL